jgi:hypothetical protein
MNVQTQDLASGVETSEHFYTKIEIWFINITKFSNLLLLLLILFRLFINFTVITYEQLFT